MKLEATQLQQILSLSSHRRMAIKKRILKDVLLADAIESALQKYLPDPTADIRASLTSSDRIKSGHGVERHAVETYRKRHTPRVAGLETLERALLQYANMCIDRFFDEADPSYIPRESSILRAQGAKEEVKNAVDLLRTKSGIFNAEQWCLAIQSYVENALVRQATNTVIVPGIPGVIRRR